ncbi:MAG: DUF6477 family protein [Pseudomonadota bacterium]
MKDIYTLLSELRRPRLLISAARHGVMEYDRQGMLKKLLGQEALPCSAEAALRLMEIEAGHNEARINSDATYQTARHVDVLIALMAEASLLAEMRRSNVVVKL